MERFCESVLTLTGSLGLLLTTDGRLLVMLSLTNLSDNASSRALPLESPQSTFQGFILTNTDLRHLVSLPSAQSFDDPLRQIRRQWSTVRLIIAQQSLFVNCIFSFFQKFLGTNCPKTPFSQILSVYVGQNPKSGHLAGHCLAAQHMQPSVMLYLPVVMYRLVVIRFMPMR